MKSFIRESYNYTKNAKLIRYYSSGREFLTVKILEFFLNLFIFWPIEIIVVGIIIFLGLVLDLLFLCLRGIWALITLPFKRLKK